MHTTENFGLSQFDATDIFNPMTVNNENAQKIDAQMKLNKDASLGIATELVSQGVHALTRLSDYETCNFFKFTATSNYEAGETFVVDGVQVQAKTVAGSNLASGAYIIGSTVLCELRDALLTIFVPGAQTADDSLALNGHPDTYFGTAEDVAAAQATATAAGNLADQNRADIVQLKENLSQYKLKEYTFEYTQAKVWVKYDIEESNVFLDGSSYLDGAFNSSNQTRVPLNYPGDSYCYIDCSNGATKICFWAERSTTFHAFVRYK